MTSQQRPGAAAWERALTAYRDPTIPVAQVIGEVGLPTATFYDELRRRGVPLRSAPTEFPGAADEDTPPASRPMPPPRSRGAGERRLAVRLEQVVGERLRSIEAGAAAGDANPEATDRRLAQLTRTLAQLRGMNAAKQKLRSGREQPDGESREDGGRTVSQLRDDLLGHLERLRLEARRRRLAGDAERA